MVYMSDANLTIFDSYSYNNFGNVESCYFFVYVYG